MKYTDKCALACYSQIAVLDERHNVFYVQHNRTGAVYIKKTLEVFDPEVFAYIRDNHIRGTPKIIEVVEDGGKLIVIEEYISGRTLRSILDCGIRFSEKQAVELIKKLCLIVQRLHNGNRIIIHRDIKPANIIVTSDGEVKLIDMNTAKYYKEGKNRDTLLLGTIGYAAPEQYGFGASGIQTDIYAIGQVLLEMIAGERKDEAAAVTGISGKLKAVIRKCTRMDPEDRYRNILELLDDLRMIEGCAGGINSVRLTGDRYFNCSSDGMGGKNEDLGKVWMDGEAGKGGRNVFSEDGIGSFGEWDAEIFREEKRAGIGRNGGVSKLRGNGSKKSIWFYFPPGFRTGNSTHMAVALLGYLAIFVLGMNFTVNDAASVALLWLERWCCTLCGLSIVFVSCNYLGVWQLLRIDRVKNRLLKTCKILIWDIVAVIVVMLVMKIIEDVWAL